ncbi:MAG: tetratricopeptide repeat protein [Acidobacteria bacterium]|nr:tetratricopeptide repeat protein [Acidobacteriota bacterium]
MKRAQRHHLKENELANTIAAARERLVARKGEVASILLAVVAIAAIVAGISAWQRQDDVRAEQLLADALIIFNAPVVPATADAGNPGEVPAAATIGATGSYATEQAKLADALPRLRAAAEAFPNTEAGVTARYLYASSLSNLGRHTEAIDAFREVIDRTGSDRLYGRMAMMGTADAQTRAGQLDAAIETWTALASSPDEQLPKDAVLIELGKVYQASGNAEEANRVFAQIVDEYPTSLYSAEAQAALDGL